jgi:hypothetical protein
MPKRTKELGSFMGFLVESLATPACLVMTFVFLAFAAVDFDMKQIADGQTDLYAAAFFFILTFIDFL